MSFASLFGQSGGYYAVVIFAGLFIDAAWWKRGHREARVVNFPLAALVVPPILITALGATLVAKPSSAGVLVALGVAEAGLAWVLYRRRRKWWPGAPVLVVAALVWTCITLFVTLVAVSGDSL